MTVTDTQAKTPLAERITSRTASVAVIGLGYVGLPLAREFANAGFTVHGLEVSSDKVELVRNGKSDIPDVPDEELAPLVQSGKLMATLDPGVLRDADCVSICVPTPLSKTKDPDVSFILKALESVKEHLHSGMLVILESTTYPGTTEELIRPQLEESGLTVGRDLYLAFSPERVDPGNPVYKTHNTPRVVGGTTPACTEIAKLFYEQIVDTVIPVTSTRAAEMVKLLENTFRAVNIALVNEVALMCDRLGIDVWEIIEAASTKPFGFMPFYPGPGLGGHCIPIDPHYLAWKLKSLNYYARFIELAGDINSRMPEYVTDKIAAALNEDEKALKGARVFVLGAAYKKDISDLRESPALDVIRLLQERGADVTYNDPHATVIRMDGGGDLCSVEISESTLGEADCVVILTDHSAYDYDFICRNSKIVVDTRNATGKMTEPAGRVRKI